MNFRGFNLIQGFHYPGIFFTSETKLKEDWILNDPNRELEEEKLQAAVETFLGNSFENTHISSLIEADTIISWIFLKMKKKIETIKKVIEETWNGAETFKQVEKLENSCLTYLRSLYNIFEKIKKFRNDNSGFIRYIVNNKLGFEELLFYSDNLEVNLYVIKLIQIIYQDEQIQNSANDIGIFAGNQVNFGIYKAYFKYFLEVIRIQYPFSVELFKSEKFFKDIGHKPETMESPTDSVKVTTSLLDMNIQSVKKEYGEHFLSVLAVRQTLEKQKVQNYDQYCSSFLNLVFSLRVAKNFSALKQRSLVFLNMILVAKSYVNNKDPNHIDSRPVNINYIKELRQCISIKNFPLNDYYLELLDIITVDKDNHSAFYKYIESEKNDQIDINGEKKFVEEFKQKIDEDFANIGKKDLILQFQALNIIVQFLNELSFFVYTKNNCDKLIDETDQTLSKISAIIQTLLQNYQQTEKKQEILDGLVFLLQAEPKLLGNQSDAGGSIGSSNSKQLWENIWAFLKTNLISQTENQSQFTQVSFSVLQQLFKNLGLTNNEFKQLEIIEQINQGYQSGNISNGKFALFTLAQVPFNFYNENQQFFFKAIQTIVSVIKNNQYESVSNSRNLYELMEKFIELYEKKNKADLQPEEWATLEDAKHLTSIGFSLKNVFKIEKLFLPDNQFSDEEEIKSKKKIYYEKQKKNLIRSLRYYLDDYVQKNLVADKELEQQILQSAAKENIYTKAYFSSILSLNALKSQVIVNQVLEKLISFKQYSQFDLEEPDLLFILDKILEIIHPCSTSNWNPLVSTINSSKESIKVLTKNSNLPEKAFQTILIQQIGKLYAETNNDQARLFSFQVLDQQRAYNNFSVNTSSQEYTTSILTYRKDQSGIDSQQAYQIQYFNSRFELLYLLLKNQLKNTDLANENLFNDSDYKEAFEQFSQFYAQHYRQTIQEKLNYNIQKILKDFDTVVKQKNKNALYKNLIDPGQKFLVQTSSNEATMFQLSKFLLSRDFLGVKMKESGRFFLGLPHRLNSVFGHHRLKHLIEGIIDKVQDSCLDLIPSKVNDSSLETLFVDLIKGIVYDIELRKTLRNKFTTINFNAYFTKMNLFLRSCHVAFQKHQLGKSHINYHQIDVQNPLSKEQFLTKTIVKILQNYKNDYNKALFTNTYIENGKQQDYNFVLKMILDPNRERYAQAQIGFLKVIQEMLDIEQLFLTGSRHQISIYTEGSQFINKLHAAIRKKKESVQKLEETNNKLLSFDLQVFKERLSQRIEMGQIANREGVRRLNQIIDNLFQIITFKILNQGLMLNESKINGLSDILKNAILWNSKGNQKKILAMICREISKILLNQLKKYNPDFNPGNHEHSYLLNFLKDICDLLPKDNTFPDDIGLFLQKLDQSSQQYPPINTAIFTHFLYVFLHKLSSQWLVIDPQLANEYSNRLFYSDFRQYLMFFEQISMHFDKTPNNLSHHVTTSLKLLKKFNTTLKDKFSKVLPTLASDYQIILPVVIKTINSLVNFADSLGFLKCQLPEKDKRVGEALQELAMLLSICVNKLKDFKLIEKQSWDSTINTIFKLFNLKCCCLKSEHRYYNNLWQLIIRIIDVLFVYQKENFVKSNYEIRLKTKIFDPKEKRYKWTFTFNELEQWIEPDMYEHHGALVTTLLQLFEGFSEDQNTLKQLIDSEILKLKKKKKEGEEGGEEEGEDQDKNKEDEEELKKQEEAERQQLDEQQQQQQQQQKEENKQGEEEQAGEQKEGQEGQDGQEKGEDQQQKNNQLQEQQLQNDQQKENQKDLLIAKKKKKKRIPEIQEAAQQSQEPVFKLKLKELDKYQIVSNKVLQLSTSQTAYIDQLIEAMEKRVIENYYSAKQNSELNSQPDQNMKDTQFAISFNYITKMLIAIISKYPLVTPYILEKKVKCPQIGFLKTENYELPFIDYLLIISVFTNQQLDQFIEVLTEISYGFVEQGKNKYVMTNEYLGVQIYDRTLLWIKKLAERSDFLEKDTNIAIFSSLVNTLLDLIKYRNEFYQNDENKFKNPLAVCLQLFKKANTLQEIDNIDNLRIFELIAVTLKELLIINFKKIGKVWDEKNSVNYINYFVNKNFFQFFEKGERRDNLEKQYILDYASIYTALPSNSKSNNVRILKTQQSVFEIKVSNQISNFVEKYLAHTFKEREILKDNRKLKYSRNQQVFGQTESIKLHQLFQSSKNENLKKKEFTNSSLFYNFIDFLYQTESSKQERTGFYQSEIERLQNNLNNEDQSYLNKFSSIQNMLEQLFQPGDQQNYENTHVYSLGVQEKGLPSLVKQNKDRYFNVDGKKEEVYGQDSDLEDLLDDSYWKGLKPKKQGKSGNIQKEEKFKSIDNQELNQYQIDQDHFSKLNQQEQTLLLHNAKQSVKLKDKLVFQFLRENYLVERYCGQSGEYIAKNLKDFLNSERMFRVVSQLEQQQQNLFLVQLETEIINNLPKDIAEQVLVAQSKIGKQKQGMKYGGSNQSKNQEEWISDDEENQNIVKLDENKSQGDENEDVYFLSDDEKNKHHDSETVYTDNVSEDYLTSKLIHNPELEKHLESLENIMSLIPTFEDEFITKLVQAVHIYKLKDNDQTEVQFKNLKAILELILLNPYNAYRFVDCIQFLLVNGVVNKQGFDNPLFELEMFDSSIINKGGLITNKRDNKILKSAALFDILDFIIDKKASIYQTVLYNYPLHKEEYSLNIDGKEQNPPYQVQFKQLPIFADFKFAQVFKGFQEISMIQLHSHYSKWLSGEKKVNEQKIAFEDVQFDYCSLALNKLVRCMNKFFKQINFEGDKRLFQSRLYPIIVRPENEMSFEFLSEIISYGINDMKGRLKDSEYWNLVRQFSRKFQNFTNFSKAFLVSISKQFREQTKKFLNELIAFKTKIKILHNLENLNENKSEVTDLFYNYEDLLQKSESFFENEMYFYRRSLKDIISLFEVSYKVEYKKLLDQVNKIANQEGEKGGEQYAKQWFKESRIAKRQEMIDQLKISWLKDDQSVLGLQIDLMEYVYTASAFAWNTNQGTPYAYKNFNYPLKSFMVLYTFLCQEKQEEGQQQEEQKQENSMSISLKDFMNKQHDEEIMENVHVLKNQTIKIFTQLRKSENLTLQDLFNVMKEKLANLVSYFLNSDYIPQKRRWMQFMKVIVRDQRSFNILDSEMKWNQLSAHSKYDVKNTGGQSSYDVQLKVRRNYIWNDTLATLVRLSSVKTVKANFEVSFVNEDGISTTEAMEQEWITLAIKDVTDPNKGLFKSTNNGVSMQPSEGSSVVPNHLLHFKYLGRLIAKGLVDKVNVQFDLSRAVLKQILKKQLNLSDLEDVDPEEYKNLNFILENNSNDLNLSFIVEKRNQFNQIQTIELIPGGKNIMVNELNKKKFVKLRAQWRLRDSIKDQIDNLVLGFYEIIPYKAVKFFDDQQLGLFLSGDKQLNIEEMKTNFIFSGGYNADSDQVKWLTELLTSTDSKTKQQFLFFVTGSFSLPVGGFKIFKICLNRLEESDRLPSVSICNRCLNLPQYPSIEILKNKLLQAIFEGSSGLLLQ